MPAGRPSKFTPEVRATILQAIREGNYRHVAASSAGIGVRTFCTWMADEGEDFQQFQQEVMEAENAAHLEMVKRVVKAATEDARHAQWWLERKFHTEWGRKDRLDVKADVNAPPSREALLAQGMALGLTEEEIFGG
jgi:hypothetical protein